MEFSYILGAALCVMAVSFIGKVMTWRGLGELIERELHFFVSFAAGVLLVITYGLVAEVVHLGDLGSGVLWIAIGAALILSAFNFIPHFHHHHVRGTHAHSRLDANRILLSDAIHNAVDGAVIATAFVVSPSIGITVTLSILIHEMLQEISEFFVLREAGLGVSRALLLNALTSSTVLVGALLTYAALGSFAILEVPLLGLAAGSYLVVIFHDLIPHSLGSAYDRRHAVRHIVFFFAGIVLMAIVTLTLPHGA